MAETVARLYGGFRGADFRGDECELFRSPDCLNVWRDYKKSDGIRTRPGMQIYHDTADTVYGIFFYKDEMLIHSGDKLLRVKAGVETEIATGLNRAVSNGFAYAEKWYFKDGANYLEYDGTFVREVSGYVPTTSIARKPSAGGTMLEDINMLTGHRINTFVADGVSREYHLDSESIDPLFVPVVKVNGVQVEGFTVDYDGGKVIFNTAPEAPATDGQDNVSIEYRKIVSGYRNAILQCRLLQVFDNRVFVSGNPEFPNVVWHCSLDDPTYFSDMDYYREGLDNANIRGLVAGNNALWVFREPSDANTTVFYHVPTIDADYGKIYPSNHSSVTTGCVGAAINFGDDIVFFSERGMEGISGDITTEQAVAHRSTTVDRKLITQNGYKDMILEEWEGYLLVIMGRDVFLADSRMTYSHEGHREYDWYYWRMERIVTSARVHNGILYLGTANGVFRLTDETVDLESYWVTPKDKMNRPNMLKTTNKRGCVVEATGDVEVYAKTEKSEFEQIGSYENVEDHAICRIKVKKFKDIQLKFQSNTRFSLEMVTLEAFVGGYVKR